MTSSPVALVLLGGEGTRLRPLTLNVNKHLLPLHDRTMAWNALECLSRSGVRRAVVVCNAGDINALRAALSDFNSRVNIEYVAVSSRSTGTGACLLQCENLVEDGDELITYWGDNIFEYNLDYFLAEPLADLECRVLITQTPRPKHFSRVKISGSHIDRISRSMSEPAPGDYVVTGCIRGRTDIFDAIRSVSANPLQELDFMDALRVYAAAGQLTYGTVHGQWMDAATDPEALVIASAFVRRGVNKTLDQ